jgi:ADP-heptose:LPS heptosyltransferase
MLRMKQVRGFCGGLGDLFAVMPFLVGSSITHLELDDWTKKPGIIDILKIVNPAIKYTFNDRVCANQHILPNIFNLKIYIGHQRQYRNNLPVLPEDVISAIGFYDDQKYIVIHPVTSTRNDLRRYPNWNEVDLSDIPCRVIGAKDDDNPLNAEIFTGDFLTVARMLRSSMCVVCVDSCILNLANVLKVPTIGIYRSKLAYQHRPCSLPPLINPSPNDIRCAMIDMLN